MSGTPHPQESATVDTGARIAVQRSARGLTQRALATRAGVSYSLLTKVESGVKPPSPALIAACERALGLDTGTLAGNPAAGDDLLELLPPIRTALDVLDLSPDETITPRPLPELAGAVHRANTWAQAAQYEPMVRTLPGLLAELHAAAHHHSGLDQQRAWALLALAVRCGHSVGIALGQGDLSVAALARMDGTAAHAGDHAPGLRAIRDYLRVTAHLRARNYAACWRLNAAGVTHLDGTDADTPGALVARGQLHLGASIIAAHTGQTDTMREHLAAAEEIAARTGEQTERLWVGFGPTNVAVHRAMAWGAAGEHARAVTAADGLRFPRGWLPTRIGHHYLDLARAYRWLNRPEKALAALQAARAVAPGQARRHPLAHDTVSALLRTTRRTSAPLSAYAAWIGA